MRISDWSSDVCSSDLECAEAESLGDVAVVGGDRGQAEATRHFNEAGPLVGGAVAICAFLFRKNDFGGALNFVGFLQTHHSGMGDGARVVARKRFDAGYRRAEESDFVDCGGLWDDAK